MRNAAFLLPKQLRVSASAGQSSPLICRCLFQGSGKQLFCAAEADGMIAGNFIRLFMAARVSTFGTRSSRTNCLSCSSGAGFKVI